MKTTFEKSISFQQAHIFPQIYQSLQNIPHWHKEHELVLVKRGNVTLTVNGSSFFLRAGMCAFVQSEDMHSITGEADSVTVVSKLDADHFHRITKDRRLQCPVLSRSYGIREHIEAILTELKEKQEFCGMIADCIATQLLARIFRQEELKEGDTAAHRQSDKKYKSLLELIAKNYADITFDDAAGFMHFSRPYFSKYFYQRSGMTFTRYLNMIKISFATEKVIEGKMTITEISQSCGFNTIRNFNRVFKEMTGYPPNSLPKNYNFIHNLREYADNGFDPTLNGTVVLDA